MNATLALLAPFHQQAEDIEDFTAEYDERERLEELARQVEVTGPPENID